MSQEIASKIKVAIDENNLNADIFKESVFEDSQYTAFVLGGDSETHSAIVTKDFGEIEKIITENSLFTKSNPGVPIAYATHFLKGAVPAAINNSTSYIQVDSTVYKSGSVKLHHKGGYVAKFYVIWDECYFEAGEKSVEIKHGHAMARGSQVDSARLSLSRGMLKTYTLRSPKRLVLRGKDGAPSLIRVYRSPLRFKSLSGERLWRPSLR